MSDLKGTIGDKLIKRDLKDISAETAEIDVDKVI